MKKLILKCFSLLFSRTQLTAAIVTGVQEVSPIIIVTPGCTTITASYKGSSASTDLLVHSATSPYLSLTTPDQMGSTATVTATIPSSAPAGGVTIKLTSLDKLSPLSIKNAVSMPASIVIPQGGVSLGFQITALKKEGQGFRQRRRSHTRDHGSVKTKKTEPDNETLLSCS